MVLSVEDRPTDGGPSQPMAVHPNRQLISWAGASYYFPHDDVPVHNYCALFVAELDWIMEATAFSSTH